MSDCESTNARQRTPTKAKNRNTLVMIVRVLPLATKAAFLPLPLGWVGAILAFNLPNTSPVAGSFHPPSNPSMARTPSERTARHAQGA